MNGINHIPELFIDNTDPVSYTHLDVYKRQVLFGVRLMFVEQREPTGNLKVEYSGNERLEIQCDFKLKDMLFDYKALYCWGCLLLKMHILKIYP